MLGDATEKNKAPCAGSYRLRGGILDDGDAFGVGSEGVGERNVFCEATDFGEWNPTEPCGEAVPCRCGEPRVEDAALLR